MGKICKQLADQWNYIGPEGSGQAMRINAAEQGFTEGDRQTMKLILLCAVSGMRLTAAHEVQDDEPAGAYTPVPHSRYEDDPAGQ